MLSTIKYTIQSAQRRNFNQKLNKKKKRFLSNTLQTQQCAHLLTIVLTLKQTHAG